MLKIRTSLSNRLIQRSLFTGFSLAFLGGLGIFAGGILMPLPLLQKWGWLLFLFSLGLITAGLLPYRKLTRLQNKPNEIRVMEQGDLEFWVRGQCKLLLSFGDIERLEYCEKNKDVFGIAVWMKEGAYFFFQYFSKRSFEELQNAIMAIREEAPEI